MKIIGSHRNTNNIFYTPLIALFMIVASATNTSLLRADDVVLVPSYAAKAVLVPKSSVGSAWKENSGFDDSGWQLCVGRPGGVGYEKDSGYENFIRLDVGVDMHNDGENPNSSCFIRIKFNANSSDLTTFKFMTLSMRYDDGFAAYLNGTKLTETNVPDPLEWNSEAPNAIESSGQEHFDVSRHLDKVRAGENLLAIHGVNAGTASSDFLIHVSLSVGTESPGEFTSSNLPIIIIDTHGEGIRDDERIQADMGIIYNKDGQRNNLTDPLNHYNGKIGIEYRGSTSQSFPKKPFRIETIDDAGNNNNVSLFGMPEENDWVLHNPYSDKSLIRNVMALKISNDIGRYASQTQLCELLLNGEYQGVYVFMEKIKRDKNRVDIASLDAEDIAGESLTGGYIIKVDKLAGEEIDGWDGENVFYQYHYPKPQDIQPQQKTYIKNFMTEFERIMKTNQYDDPNVGYPKYIDMESLVDHFIINEVSRNIDAYRLSAFMYKDRDDNDPKLKIGPVWDFNLSFGNADYFDGWKSDGWNLDHLIIYTAHEFTPPFWWKRMRETNDFKGRLYRRWQALRNGVLQTDELINYIDSITTTLDEAQRRNFNKWQILGVELWPNWFVGNTYDEEIIFMKEWLVDRLDWMDTAIDEYKALAVQEQEQENRLVEYGLQQNFPNPFNPSTRIQFSLPKSMHVTLAVYNTMAQKVRVLIDGQMVAGTHHVHWDGTDENGSRVANSIYFYSLQSELGLKRKKMMLLQ
ncbi:CotH kinase family protein [candidate division KSB1 bacterium]|nr:CotH kinase family protein [candidate division KSB1 bacterium]